MYFSRAALGLVLDGSGPAHAATHALIRHQSLERFAGSAAWPGIAGRDAMPATHTRYSGR